MTTRLLTTEDTQQNLHLPEQIVVTSTLLETVLKMSVRSWMLLLFLLSAGSSLDAVDVNWLTRIVEGLMREYQEEGKRIEGQFCLVANIPLKQDPNTLLGLLQNDRYERNVEYTLGRGVVYRGTNVVIAKPTDSVHAELRVLENLQPLIDNSEDRLLLIYSYLSPCQTCTGWGDENIIQYIEENVIRHWKDSAFVFKIVYDNPRRGDPPNPRELRQSLIDLGRSGINLTNIFRCYKPKKFEFQCHSCSSQGRVSDICIDNKAVPQQGGSRSSSRDIRNRDSRNRDIRSRNRSSRNSYGVSSRKRRRYSSEGSRSSGV